VSARQRALLIALVAAVIGLAGVLVVVGSRPRHASRLQAGLNGSGTSNGGGSTSPTTVELVPVLPGSVPTTAPPVTAAPTTAASTATTSTTAPPALSGSGAVLVAPASPDHRAFVAGASCQTLVDEGWSVVGCGAIRAKGVVLTWLTESRPTGGTRAYVFGPGGAGTEEVVLETLDDQGARFAGVNVRIDSIAGDATQDLVVGFRNLGSGSILSVDMVQGPGVVAVHQDLSHGAARSATGQLDTWAGVVAPGDPNCCPSSFLHDTIRFLDGAWRIAVDVTVPANAVPPSQL
jgi:hypothetical protein